MVASCCVRGCANRRKAGNGLSFFRIPLKPDEKRNAWITAINRAPATKSLKLWQPSKHDRLCSHHFETGRPHNDPFHPDYVPSKNLGYKKSKPAAATLIGRFHRRQERDEQRQKRTENDTALDAATALMSLATATVTEELTKEQATQTVNDVSLSLYVAEAKLRSVEKEVEIVQQQRNQLHERLQEQISKPSVKQFTYENVKHDIQFYTGIKLEIFNFLVKKIKKFPCTSLSVLDSLLLTLMRLRLGTPNKDLSLRFKVSISTVTNIIEMMLDMLSTSLRNLIVWPERDVIRSNVPDSFRPKYRKVVSIIDCFEIFTDRPTNLTARAQCWSNYKHSSTIKYLISITPAGAISFISEGWGGRVSDKQITLESGYLNKLQHGDEIMADRGFTVETECAAHGALLHIPSFTRGKKQLSGSEVTKSRELARLRIHVERVIASLRTFRILSNKCPLTLVKQLDKIVIIIAALVNLQNAIIKQ